MADLLDAISDAREVVKTISSVDDRISLITSQIDTAPKLSQCWSAPIPPFDYQSDRHCAKTVYLSTLYLGDEEARAIEIAERFVSNGTLPTINVIDRAGRPMPLKKKDAGLGS